MLPPAALAQQHISALSPSLVAVAASAPPLLQSAAKQAAANGIEAALAELDMDHYDSTDDERDAEEVDMDGEGGASAAVVARALGGRSSGVVLDDPYLAAGADSDQEDADGLGDMDSEDRDDYVLRPDDLLILAARTEDDVSTLEVWVYEEASISTGAGVGGSGGAL
jgi:periodic tryptophan protein 1